VEEGEDVGALDMWRHDGSSVDCGGGVEPGRHDCCLSKILQRTFERYEEEKDPRGEEKLPGSYRITVDWGTR